MTRLVWTLDIDWASEAAISEALERLAKFGISPTVFSTHDSKVLRSALSTLAVGLHPFFDPDSSHGTTVEEVASYVAALPHNLAAYRCHRFQRSNASELAMRQIGMRAVSNVCGDCDAPSPFRNRHGMLEIPAALEDGGYLERGHPLTLGGPIQRLLDLGRDVVVILHPMHLVLNSPSLAWMRRIKDRASRSEWNALDPDTLDEMRWRGRGIADVVQELLGLACASSSFAELAAERGVDVTRRSGTTQLLHPPVAP